MSRLSSVVDWLWGGLGRYERRALELSQHVHNASPAVHHQRDEAAARLFRKLAVHRPDRHQAEFACVLSRLARTAWVTGDKEKALTLSREAATVYCSAAARHDWYASPAGSTLTRLAGWQEETGRFDAALETLVEASDLYRSVPVDDSQLSAGCQLALGEVLMAQGTALRRAGRPVGALAAVDEAIDVLGSLGAQLGAGPAQCLAQAWALRADLLRAQGDERAGLLADEETANARRLAMRRRPKRDLKDSVACLEGSLRASRPDREAAVLRAARRDEWLALAGDVARNGPTYPVDHQRAFKLLARCRDQLAGHGATDDDLATIGDFMDAQVELAKQVCWADQDGMGVACCAPNNPCWVADLVIREALEAGGADR